MKKESLIIIFLLLLTSCIEDEGNYNYQPLQEIEILGLEDSYRFTLQQPIELIPELNTDIEEENLSYCWRIGADTLLKTRDFKYTFKDVPVSSDPLTFDILDKRTNVRYSKAMSISIVSPFYTGWLILSEMETGEANLSFQSYEEQKALYKDIYYQLNGEKLMGSPIMVKQLSYRDGITGGNYDRVSIICSDRSVELDGNSFLTCKYYDEEFKDLTPNIEYITSEYYSSDFALSIISDGLIYGKISGSLGSPDDGYYQYPFAGDEKGYYVAPALVRAGYTTYYYGFDELNNRFVYYNAKTLSSKVSPLIWNEMESINSVNKENIPGSLKWMGGILYSENIYAITENNGNYFLWKMYVKYDGVVTLLNYTQLPDNLISKNSSFALHPTSPYLFISNENNLKALNLETVATGINAVNDICSYDGNITTMHYAYVANKNVDEFGIAIQTGNNESSLLIINPVLTSKGEILQRYDHINGKIKSICRKVM